jgi:hypothetical protein
VYFTKVRETLPGVVIRSLGNYQCTPFDTESDERGKCVLRAGRIESPVIDHDHLSFGSPIA